jgi:hypothetical protein
MANNAPRSSNTFQQGLSVSGFIQPPGGKYPSHNYPRHYHRAPHAHGPPVAITWSPIEKVFDRTAPANAPTATVAIDCGVNDNPCLRAVGNRKCNWKAWTPQRLRHDCGTTAAVCRCRRPWPTLHPAKRCVSLFVRQRIG